MYIGDLDGVMFTRELAYQTRDRVYPIAVEKPAMLGSLIDMDIQGNLNKGHRIDCRFDARASRLGEDSNIHRSTSWFFCLVVCSLVVTARGQLTAGVGQGEGGGRLILTVIHSVSLTNWGTLCE